MRIFLLGLLLCFSVVAVAFADLVDYSWTGPDIPSPTNFFSGTPCLASSSTCVPGTTDSNGDPFAIQSVKLAEISASGTGASQVQTWTLTVSEDAPFGLPSELGFNATAFGDFLFQSPAVSGSFYGIVLGGTCTDPSGWEANTSPAETGACTTYNGHDGLTAGAVYQGPGTSLSTAYQNATFGRTGDPSWLSASSTNVDAFNGLSGFNPTSFSVTRTSGAVKDSNGDYYATYTIADTFEVNAGVIDTTGNLFASISSYVCDNEIFDGGPTTVPEPRAMFLIIPAMLLLGRRLARSRSVQTT